MDKIRSRKGEVRAWLDWFSDTVFRLTPSKRTFSTTYLISCGMASGTRVSDGPIAVGSQYRSVGKLMGKDVANDIRITEYEPHSRIAFVSNDGKADFSQEMDFSPNNGGTLLERKLTFEASALMALMIKLLIGPLVANRSMNKSLKNLKAKVESGAS